MVLNPRDTLTELAFESQLVALAAAVESASAEQYSQSLARTAAELNRLAAIGRDTAGPPAGINSVSSDRQPLAPA